MISAGTKMIVGLGNPGSAYAGTRHNIGFTVLKSLASDLKISFKFDRLCRSFVGSKNGLVLALPQTYMNLSGLAVKALLKKFKALPQDLLVVCDDLDLDPGRLKLRPGGSSGGHRGLESIIEHLGTRDFPRLRLGIGRPAQGLDAAEYVLEDFSNAQAAQMKIVREQAVSCCLSWLENGTEKSMNKFNAAAKTAKVNVNPKNKKESGE